MNDQIRIILVKPAHPGNIGSVARGMKTMGLSQLYLVNPEKYPHKEATWLASNAEDILNGAVVVNSLKEALVGCSFVVGTSARQRRVPWPQLDARQCARRVCAEAKQHQVAVVFGPENKGLDNESLQICHAHVHIPTSPEYTSLNLAASVQIICYEILMQQYLASEVNALENETDHLSHAWGVEWDEPLATTEELEQFFEHLEKVLIDIDFYNPANPRRLMVRLRRLFSRARMDKMEINILRGMLAATQKKL